MVGMNETQTRLLDLGEALMCQRGFDGFSYADIASEAGIRKASIHYHFPTKQDLGAAVLERYNKRLQRQLSDIARASRTGGQALTAVIDLYRPQAVSAARLCLCVALTGDSHSISEPMQQALHRSNEQVVHAIEEMLLAGRRDRSISVGGDPHQEACSILATLQGAQMMARAANDPTMFDQAIAILSSRISRH